MGVRENKWPGLLNGPSSKPELTAREMLEIALAKCKKNKPECVVVVTQKEVSE